MKLTNLRCEYFTDPLGIDAPRPRLSWVVEDIRQTACQILIASSATKLAANDGDLWDTGRLESSQSIHVEYAGEKLQPRMSCHWKVRGWNQDNQMSEWSAPAVWEMGLNDWQAQWIGPADSSRLPLLRREFDLPGKIVKARAYVCGLGQYELRVNGAKVDDHFLAPGWTDYRKRCLYVTHDITARLKTGANAIGVMLGNGMYNVTAGRYAKFTGSFGPPKLICEVHVEFADGSSARIVSDETWKTRYSPITFSCIFGGEDYDARLEAVGWDQPGFNDVGWLAAVVTPGPGGVLAAQGALCVQVQETLPTVSRTELKHDTFVFDLGQNAAGVPRLTVEGAAGGRVRLTPAEVLDAQGRADQTYTGTPHHYTYTLKGEGQEVWRPRFTFYGFRYVQAECENISAHIARPKVVDVQCDVVHATVKRAGSFTCSKPLFNRIHEIIVWAIRSNMNHILMDCPHREKLGWLEEQHLMGPAILFNFDAAPLYRKIIRDMIDAQLPDGLVPNIAPEYRFGKGPYRDSPEWGSACVVIPWLLYQWCGDVGALREAYEMMSRYLNYLTSKSEGHLISHGLGDWLDVGAKGVSGDSVFTPQGVTAAAIYYHDACILQRVATVLGKSADAALAGNIRAAFNAKYFNPVTGQYASNSQTANAMALQLGLVAPEHRTAVLESLVADVRKNGNHTTSGDVGHRFVLQALAEGGRSDVVFDMASRTDHPSYGFQIEHGATALTERWDGPTTGLSQNHFMLGHIEEWFYRSLAGINPDRDVVLIQPQIVGDLTWVEASYESMRGMITSRWERTDNHVQLDVTLPGNTRGLVRLGQTEREICPGLTQLNATIAT